MKKMSSKRGYTLLFAVLTATLVLGVTVFIVTVSRKQFLLATIARESTHAIYAASTGLECAIIGSYARFTYDENEVPSDSQVSIGCDGKPQKSSGWQTNVSMNGRFGLATADKTETLTFSLPNGCTQITVFYGTDALGATKTIIESRGYNICDTSIDNNGNEKHTPSPSPKTVERIFRYTIQ